MWLLTCILQSWARNYVVVLQSDTHQEYETTTQSLIESLPGYVKRYQLQGSEERADSFGAELQVDPPPLVFAIGAKAAYTTKKYVPNVPVVYAVIQDPNRFGIEGENVYGVSMDVATDLALAQYRFFLPELKKIGLIVGTQTSDVKINEITNVGKEYGFEISVIKITNYKDVRTQLEPQLAQVDAIWLAQDMSLLQDELFFQISDMSKRYRKPLLTNSKALTRAGGFLGVAPDLKKVGSMTAELGQGLLKGQYEGEHTLYTLDVEVFINRRTQNAIGIQLSEHCNAFVSEEVE